MTIRATIHQPSSCTDETTQYAVDVVEGRIVAGPHVRDACRRHLRDLDTGHERGLWFDVEAAERFFRFCRTVLRLSEGQFEDTPFELHASQKFICGSLFGWKTSEGVRRFRRAYIEQGKGNGKSPMVGAIGLYGLVADGEAGAQIYSAGSTKEQASVLFQDACKMVRKANPKWSSQLTFAGGQGREFNIAHLKSGSFFRPVSRETKKTGSGPRPHFALCDEVHEHPDSGVIEILERGFKFRRQPLIIMITNSGSDRGSVCWQEHKRAIAIAAGDEDDDTTFSYVCALDEGDDPLVDPSCWVKANPLLGVTITEEYLALQAKQARDIAGRANGIRRLHFCQWTDATTAWISRKTWEQVEDPTLDIEDFVGKRACMGLDLSARKDLTAKALIFDDGFTEDGRPKYAAFVHGYTPEIGIRSRAEKDQEAYDQWVEKGLLTATPGEKIRLEFVAADVFADCERFDVTMIAYDNYLIDKFEEELDATGGTFPIVDHPQGWHKRKRELSDGREIHLGMPWSIDEFETLIMERRIRVHANEALRSAVMSTAFETSPAGLRRFTKSKSYKRIDMAVALAMAVGAAAQTNTKVASVYDERGLLMV